MGFSSKRLRADDPCRAPGLELKLLLPPAPREALMERLPETLSIALWVVGACWTLAIVGYAFGVSTEWIFAVFMFGLLTGATEWLLRGNAKR
jgi:hypothetical protein